MMPLAASFSLSTSPIFPRNIESRSISSVYELARAIFRVIVMTYQYAEGKFSSTLHHVFFWPAALAKRNITVFSQNIASFKLLQTCFSTALWPESKRMYQEIGRTHGFRVTHDIVLKPASGLCLGMALVFLAEYLFADKKKDPLVNLRAAAQSVQGEKNEQSVRVQAIYSAMLGVNGKFKSEERKFFLDVLKEKPYSFQAAPNKELLKSIEAFFKSEESSQTLRQFVFDDLESRGVNISPNLYALILELDRCWHVQKHPLERKNDALHQAIMECLSRELKLDLIKAIRINGKRESVCKQLQKLKKGSYSIQFAKHSIVCIKTSHHLALFNPNEGLAILNSKNQKEALLKLLKYYGNGAFNSLKVLQFQPNYRTEVH